MICVYEDLLIQIDQAIEHCEGKLAQDIIELIGIKSVKGDPLPGAPFGEGPKQVLDAVMKIGEAEGFFAVDHRVGVVSLALKDCQPDLGIWVHGDVVPEGSNWDWPAYNASAYKGVIIGRGATDNKGQLCAMIHLLRIFKDLGISLNYNPAVYVGSDEECGMHDLIGIPGNDDARGFCNVCTPPCLSLVPDSSFPVGYGGNGAMQMCFSARKSFKNITITAGQKDAPDRARCELGDKIWETSSPMRHPSNPDPNGNMITTLMKQLLEENIVSEEHRPALEFFKRLSLDIHGESFGIHVRTQQLKPVTVFTHQIEMQDDAPVCTINLRYPIEITAEEIIDKMSTEAEKYGVFLVSVEHQRKPYLLDLDWPVLQKLKEVAEQITQDEKKPYTIGGGTYAHWLPNALIYGTDAGLPPEDFPKGHGFAHGPDECVSLNRLKRAMKIYARALLALNEMEW